jgi:hypothetical protein
MSSNKTISKKVCLLAAADPDSLSGKALKARDYGIPVTRFHGVDGLLCTRQTRASTHQSDSAAYLLGVSRRGVLLRIQVRIKPATRMRDMHERRRLG